MARKELTPEQEAFIRNNYATMEYKDIAAEIDMNINTLYWWCKEHGLRKRRIGRKRDINKKTKQMAKIMALKPAAVKTGKYWPADHTNPSREDHVERILNTQI
jgi:hypothetical protein